MDYNNSELPLGFGMALMMNERARAGFEGLSETEKELKEVEANLSQAMKDLKVLDGDISVGAFAAVFSSIDTLFSSMEYFIGSHLGSIAENFGEIRNFLRFLQIPSNCRSNIKIDKKRGITLQNVSFRYPNSSVSSLRNINLTLNPGETVALVGDNGAGRRNNSADEPGWCDHAAVGTGGGENVQLVFCTGCADIEKP